MENGKVAIARHLTNRVGVGSTEFHVVRARESIEPLFLLHYLLQLRIRQDARAVMQGAAGQLRVPATFLKGLVVPLPPQAEQRRIVTEIEEQFSRLEAAIASLRHAKANMRRLRTSVISSMLQWNAWPKVAMSRLIEKIEAGQTSGARNGLQIETSSVWSRSVRSLGAGSTKTPQKHVRIQSASTRGGWSALGTS
jgi:hypothetical protein